METHVHRVKLFVQINFSKANGIVVEVIRGRTVSRANFSINWRLRQEIIQNFQKGQVRRVLLSVLIGVDFVGLGWIVSNEVVVVKGFGTDG